MRIHVLAAALLGLAPGLAAPQALDGAREPCAAASARLGSRAVTAIEDARAEIDAYRAAWRVACDPGRGAADVASLLSDAEALVSDVRLARVVAELSRALEPRATWPLPGVHRSGEGLELDWAAFAAIFERGTAEDSRFFRGLTRATRAGGEPVWLGPVPAADGARCVRLGEIAWVDVADGIEQMERSGPEVYSRRVAALREQLLETLRALGGGGPVCGCVRGDPLPALAALAGGARARSGTPERRALLAAAASAVEALRSGKTRLTWLRESADAPATGCGAGAR